MELTGNVIAIMQANSGVSQRTGNAWMNQEYVIEVPGQYPKKCVFKVSGEARIKQFNIQMGETITIQFDIDAHEYNGKYYPEITCYNVIRQGQQQAVPQGQYQQPMQQQMPPQGYQQAPAQSPFPQQQMPPQQPAPGAAPFPPQQPQPQAPQGQQGALPF